MTPADRVEKCFAGVTLPLDSLDIEVLKLSMEEAIREAIAEEREVAEPRGANDVVPKHITFIDVVGTDGGKASVEVIKTPKSEAERGRHDPS